MLASSSLRSCGLVSVKIITKNEQILFELGHHVKRNQRQDVHLNIYSRQLTAPAPRSHEYPEQPDTHSVQSRQAPSPNKNLNYHDINKYI